jgi:HEAT repeat protein
MRIRGLTRQVDTWLREPTLAGALTALAAIPPDRRIKPLFSCLCSCEPRVKWYAVSAMGQTVATMADQEMESARVVMRRFMWMLNDESGGIGWGVPEAMAECLARHAGLAYEYTHCLVAFMREDGFYLELPALQQGLLWGVARLAGVAPAPLRTREAVRYLLPYLESEDQGVKGLACLALGRLGDQSLLATLSPLVSDLRPVSLYQDGFFLESTVADLARQAIMLLGGKAGVLL